MSRIAREVPTVQLVSGDWAMIGLQNEKYRKLNLLELGLNFGGGLFNRCLAQV